MHTVKRNLAALLALTFGVSLCSVAQATSGSVGAEMAAAMTQKMLSAPALPSLDGGSNSVGISYGVSDLQMSDQLATSGVFLTSDGKGHGQQFGLSLTIPTKSDFGFFFFVLGNQSTGEVHIFQNGAATYDMRDIKTSSTAAIGGISYRLLGSETSTFAMGPFAGPALVTIHSTSSFVPTGMNAGSPATEFKLDPVSPGVFLGLQAIARLGNFRINPYFVVLVDTSDPCKSVTATGAATPYSCGGVEGKMDVTTSFAGAGVYVGYRWIQVNAYSEVLTAGRFKTTSLTGSVSIPF